ncbi:MAG: hypothetical protein ACPF9K_01445 [Neptuniibacter sp.]
MQEVEIEVLERLLHSLTMEVNGYPDPKTHEEFLESLEQMMFDYLLKNVENAKALFAFMSEAANNPKVKVLLRTLSDDLVLNWQRQLSALSPAVSAASLNNTAQIISTIHIGLMTRFFITEDQTSLKLYWRGCKGLLEGLLGITGQTQYEQTSDKVLPGLSVAHIN